MHYCALPCWIRVAVGPWAGLTWRMGINILPVFVYLIYRDEQLFIICLYFILQNFSSANNIFLDIHLLVCSQVQFMNKVYLFEGKKGFFTYSIFFSGFVQICSAKDKSLESGENKTIHVSRDKLPTLSGCTMGNQFIFRQPVKSKPSYCVYIWST